MNIEGKWISDIRTHVKDKEKRLPHGYSDSSQFQNIFLEYYDDNPDGFYDLVINQYDYDEDGNLLSEFHYNCGDWKQKDYDEAGHIIKSQTYFALGEYYFGFLEYDGDRLIRSSAYKNKEDYLFYTYDYEY